MRQKRSMCGSRRATENDLHFLQPPRGTFDDAERAEIELLAEETYRFLVNIPCTEVYALR